MDADFGRRLARRTLAVGSCLLFALPALAAQGTGSVRGRVTAESGRPLDAAQVWVPGTNRVTRTDEKGEYRLNGVPAGTVQLRAQRGPAPGDVAQSRRA